MTEVNEDITELENLNNRLILGAVLGARIPGVCDDCAGHVRVRDVAGATRVEEARFRLVWFHQEGCPYHAGTTG